jgi:hypothetical protein
MSTRKAAQRQRLAGGEGKWAQKWGRNDDCDEYDTDDVASNDPTINKTMTMAARGGGAATESDCGNGNKWGRSDDDDEYESNDAEATAFARRQHPVARRPPAPCVAIWWMCRGPQPVHDGARMRPTGVTNNEKGATELPPLKICVAQKFVCLYFFILQFSKSLFLLY